MTTVQKIGRVAIPVALMVLPALVFAQFNQPNPNAVGGSAITLADIQTYIERIASFLIVVGVILAVIFIIWGGITYMAAGGSDDKVKTARARIFNGIIGAAVVLGVGVILQTVAGLVARTFFS